MRKSCREKCLRIEPIKTPSLEHDNALERVIVEVLTDHTELFKQFVDNQSIKKWLADAIFNETYKKKFA